MKRKLYLTTEELADQLIRCIEKQSPDDKAKARLALRRAFGNEPVTLHEGVNIFVRDLSKLSSRTRMWLRFWKVRN